MSDIPLQQAAQNEPCHSCLTALEAAASMARLVLQGVWHIFCFIVDIQMLIEARYDTRPPYSRRTQRNRRGHTGSLELMVRLLPGMLSFYFNTSLSESVENAAGGTSTAGESAIPLVADPATEDHRWYAVTVGRAPGVYRGAYHLSGNSTGTPGGTVQRFSDMHCALAAYQAAVLAGSVVEVTVATTHHVVYNDLSTLIPVLKALTFTLILVVLPLLPLILAVLSLAIIFLLSA
ncbi:uncharacterized protein LACBIDRAFT_330628 [Laccaria bicolor S238N-H82]|uniref:Predicted protein n=1 Tax=Laccaria bicolor (strain S238N-H82 / ATCC MYA-4686) TaxID=486041 RepID=B0DLY3_LACBS|nr:uncharacterized protein LACBIDRAFT_330628 [Laccaria bicolor S238N-H82]EDR04373.1 predicted protein [Laccaria bicolor S238N-H82]|eukprot:XP_001884892.1 predicted protein [Laccaria bicolor S238N-H82]